MRRKAREIALQLLFQKEFAPPITPRLWQATVSSDESSSDKEQIAPESFKYAEILVQGIQEKQPEIDSLIQRYSQHWKIDRMTTIDRNIIRLGIYEMKFANEPLPGSIAINEAVELAKVFSTTDSPSFINGLLDQINKTNI
jgi:N utilization substance protein B